MIINTEYIRLILKNSSMNSQTPTIPISSDINDFIITDIFESELFLNSTSKSLFTRSGSNIIKLTGKDEPIFQHETSSLVTTNAETDVLVLDTTNNPITVTFTTPGSTKFLTVKKLGTNPVTFNSALDGDTSFELDDSLFNESVKVYYNITWKIVNTSVTILEPSSIFTVDRNVNINDVVTVNNLSTYSDTYLWDFGDGTTSTLTNPTHTYLSTGNYVIGLTASNIGINPDYSSQDISIYDLETSFTYSVTGFEVDFTNSSTSSNLTLVSTEWDFGDGTTSSLTNPTHTYEAPGTYSPTLEMTYDINGETIIGTSSDEIDVQGPSSSFTVDSDYYRINENLTFTNTSSNSDTYLWDFGDGTTSTLTNPSHSYSIADDYIVSLTASSGGSFPDISTKTLEVYDYNINFSSSIDELEVTFTNQTTTDNIVVDSYLWDFGDGTTSSLTNPTHTYSAPGTYTVQLTTNFSIGGDIITDSISQVISITTTATLLTIDTTLGTGDDFTMSPQLEDRNVNYTSPFTIDWGDGTIETLTGHKNHTYAIGGQYNIKITGNFSGFYFGNSTLNNRLKVKELTNWGDAVWGEVGEEEMDGAFNNCTNLVITATDIPNMSLVTNMSGMFSGCSSITDIPNINSWNTTGVIYMESIFQGTNFNNDIGSWDTSSVRFMDSMFAGTPFNHDIGSWNVSNVEGMTYMFNNTPFNHDIGSWNVSSVTNMSHMFRGASIFNQPIGSWNISNVTGAFAMFKDASSFNQYIGGWSTGGIGSFSWMFEGASSFNQDIGNWDTSGSIFMDRMFNGATVFSQYLGGWCVTNITSEPPDFSTGSSLTVWDEPVWGTCP